MSITLDKFLPERKGFVIPCPLKPPATYRDIIRYAKRLSGIICAKEGVPPPTDVLIRASVKPYKYSNFRWFLSKPVGGIYDYVNERIVLAKWVVDYYLNLPEHKKYEFFCDYLVEIIAHETKHHIQHKTLREAILKEMARTSELEEEAYPYGKMFKRECFKRCIYKR
ncbi:hypothetical protein DRN52_07360 [Thermococci archaeon]|nr:MAG: hypothetical protein DRN52_07360 [Thermococci archaeon]